MKPTYYHISKTSKQDIIRFLDSVNYRFTRSKNVRDANIARVAKIISNKLTKLKECSTT